MPLCSVEEGIASGPPASAEPQQSLLPDMSKSATAQREYMQDKDPSSTRGAGVQATLEGERRQACSA